MMVAVFAAITVALAAAMIGRLWLAWAGVLACLALSIWLFLFEVYSQDYGFGMPWLNF